MFVCIDLVWVNILKIVFRVFYIFSFIGCFVYFMDIDFMFFEFLYILFDRVVYKFCMVFLGLGNDGFG